MPKWKVLMNLEPPVARLSRSSRLTAGILLLSIVAIEFGGYYLTGVVTGGGMELTEFQRSFARAGHAHAGVLVTLGLVGTVLADSARLPRTLTHVARSGIPFAAILMPAGFFLSSTGAGRTEPNDMIILLWLGAASLGLGALSLGIGLLREHRDAPAPGETR